MDLILKGFSDHPDLVAVSVTRKLNAILGGAFLTPWDLPHLDPLWVDAMLAWAEGGNPEAAAKMKQVKTRQSEWRKQFKTTRKH